MFSISSSRKKRHAISILHSAWYSSILRTIMDIASEVLSARLLLRNDNPSLASGGVASKWVRLRRGHTIQNVEIMRIWFDMTEFQVDGMPLSNLSAAYQAEPAAHTSHMHGLSCSL